MDLQLREKKALVTGSTAGIGFAIASLLAQEGASVVVNGRSQQRVGDAVQRIHREQQDAQVTGVAADLGTREGVDLLTKTVPAVDILVNNLGIYEAKLFAEITDEDWLRFFEVNVLSGVRLSRFYLPQMLQKNWESKHSVSSKACRTCSGPITCPNRSRRSKTRPASPAGTKHSSLSIFVTASLVPAFVINTRYQAAVTCAPSNGIAFRASPAGSVSRTAGRP